MVASIFLADGFEEIEAIAVIDILRRANIEVKVVGVANKIITGAHGITVTCDVEDKNFEFDNKIKMLILPGGMPGTLNLQNSKFVCSAIDIAIEKNIYIAAICAAPIILGEQGLLKGKETVCYPGFEKKLLGSKVVNSLICVDGQFITAKGPGVAIDFALQLVDILSKDKLEQVKKDLLI